MKRKSREVNVFSMSALDLFASALGAFILLAVIFMPFFPNTGDHPKISEAVRNQLEQTKRELMDAEGMLAEAQSNLEQAQSNSEALQRENETLSQALESETDRMTLLGLETKAKKIGLLIDMSGSMNQPGNDFREILKDTVKRLIGSFEDDVEVFIMGFHAPDEIPSFPTVPTNGFFLAKQNETRINTEVASFMNQVGGGTPTLGVLEKALSLNPEAIIILTDGAPSVPDENWQGVIEGVNRANSRNAEIHAVAIGPFYDDVNFTLFLGRLVAENDGYIAAAVP